MFAMSPLQSWAVIALILGCIGSWVFNSVTATHERVNNDVVVEHARRSEPESVPVEAPEPVASVTDIRSARSAGDHGTDDEEDWLAAWRGVL
ncbi:hypothetical protein [Arthrobacter castelli]|uniref:hypothetical protein n=1 Tax=Arthrobacter castelli TaxID=271431 RepID=UPI0004159D77|nr:hypothetical protein [Arthrobacter castelli]